MYHLYTLHRLRHGWSRCWEAVLELDVPLRLHLLYEPFERWRFRHRFRSLRLWLWAFILRSDEDFHWKYIESLPQYEPQNHLRKPKLCHANDLQHGLSIFEGKCSKKMCLCRWVHNRGFWGRKLPYRYDAFGMGWDWAKCIFDSLWTVKITSLIAIVKRRGTTTAVTFILLKYIKYPY